MRDEDVTAIQEWLQLAELVTVSKDGGNPGGRPKGARNRTTLAVESLLQGEAEVITRKAIELAKSGDTVALRLILERVVPVRRGKPVCFDLPLIEKAEDVSTALGAILTAMARGELTPDEAATIAGILETKRRQSSPLRYCIKPRGASDAGGICPVRSERGADAIPRLDRVAGGRRHADPRNRPAGRLDHGHGLKMASTLRAAPARRPR